jgi:uncharacterized RDD family membrane protein YckC
MYLVEDISLNQEIDVKYIGFWDRVGMRILDILITAIPFVLIYKYSLVLSVKVESIYPFFIYWIIFYVFYVFMTVRYGGTPGKLILKARIVSKSGSCLNIKNAILRLGFYIPYSIVTILILQEGLNSNINSHDVLHFLSIHKGTFKSIQVLLSFLIIIDEIYLIFNKKKRAIHDLLAGSFVVSKESALNIKDSNNTFIF